MPIRRLWPLLAFLLVYGCSRAPREETNPSTVRPVAPQRVVNFPSDDLGRVIQLKKPARRVVCIGPGATEIVFALGAGSKLIGRDQQSDYPSGVRKVAVAGDFNGPFPEKVVALRPDLIIVQGETYDRARAETWEKKCGAPVAVLRPSTAHEVRQGIEKIGAWLGKSGEAQKVAASVTPGFEFMVEPPNSGPYAFFEVGRSPLWTAGRGTLIDDVVQRAGLVNVARDVQGYKQYNLEVLATKEPDVYIVASGKAGTPGRAEREAVQKELLASPALRNLQCVREGRVILVPADWALRPGPRLALGIRSIHDQAKILLGAGDGVLRHHGKRIQKN